MHEIPFSAEAKRMTTLHASGDGTVNKLFDLLFCEGCIGGPVMVNDLTFFERKKYVVQYMEGRSQIGDIEEWAGQHAEYAIAFVGARLGERDRPRPR